MSRIRKMAAAIAVLFLITAIVAGTASAQSYTVSNMIFSDGLSNDANWTTLGSSDLFDWLTTFGYDYGNANDTIPAAPGGADTIGLKMEANLSTEFPQEIAVVHEDAAFTGQYAMQADVWMNWSVFDPEPDPTTEFGGIGVGHDGFTEGRNGALMIFTGDGGAARDYRFYEDFDHQLIEDSAQYAVSTQNANSTETPFADAFPILTNADLAAMVPGQVANGLSGTQDRPGSAGFRWMTVTALTDTAGIGSGESPGAAGTTKFFIESDDLGPSSRVYVGEIDNTNLTGEVNMGGSIALFYADIFSSLNLDPQSSSDFLTTSAFGTIGSS